VSLVCPGPKENTPFRPHTHKNIQEKKEYSRLKRIFKVREKEKEREREREKERERGCKKRGRGRKGKLKNEEIKGMGRSQMGGRTDLSICVIYCFWM
jgi:hypothetical protein